MYKLKILNLIQEKAANCTACGLHANRNKSVFSRGSCESKLFIIGEAPGQNESEQGIPFVGRSGKLLNNMIISIGLDLDNDVYIANVIKCHPPNNRKPEQNEVSVCIEYLKMQLEIIRPKCILTLGATATDALLGPGPGITKRRGVVHSYTFDDGLVANIIPSYHPAFLLRNPSAKKEAVEDLKLVLGYLNEKK